MRTNFFQGKQVDFFWIFNNKWCPIFHLTQKSEKCKGTHIILFFDMLFLGGIHSDN